MGIVTEYNSGKKVKHVIIFFVLMLFVFVQYFILRKIMVEKNRNEFLRTINCAKVIEKYGIEQTYKLEFDCKSDVAGNMRVYFQNGNGSRYGFAEIIATSQNYQHYIIYVNPVLIDESEEDAYISFYGGYGSGVIPRVKNISFVLNE